ncbi:MAG: choice-of-anchor D domain-containing protein [Planctomycetes bacterium]|nr:choice-of-anchor D domain-containing protein [Planctomycetota bacterium]
MNLKIAMLAVVLITAATLKAQDYGDAPAPYPACMHLDQSQGTRLDVIGFTVSDDGYLAAQRVGNGWTSDFGDDGVEYFNFSKGGSAQVKVAVVQTVTTGDLCVWMDFNNDGDWDDAGERVIWAGYSSSAPNGPFSARISTPGSSDTSFNTYSVAIPSGAVGTSCKVRVRLWDTGSHTSGAMMANGGGSPSAITDYGECEDNDVPYGTSTGSKANVTVYDNGLMQTTTQLPRGSTDNRGNVTAGVQSTFYYAFNCLATATYALRFTQNPTAVITPISNCTVVPFIVPAQGVTGTPGDNSYFIIIFGVTPTTAGSPFSASITMYVNEPNLPTYTWTVTGNAVPPSPKLELQRPAYTPIANGSTDNVGSIPTGSGQSVTWYIFNNGSATLNLTGSPYVQLSGFSNCSASVTTQPYPTLQGGGWSTTFDLQIVPAGSGSFSFQISIASNDTSANPYTITVAGNGGASGGTPNMNVQRPVSTVIANGGSDNLGTINAGTGSSYSYTIGNTGTGALLLNGSPLVALSGLSNCGVTVTTQPASSVAAASSTTFVILVTPSIAGAFSFTISIANTDASKNPYIINVSGNATSTNAPEIDVQRPSGSTITSGGTDNAGSLAIGSASTLTYTVANLGTASLTLNGATPVTLSGLSNCTASVTAQPAGSVSASASTTFTISVTPGAAGAFSFTVSISNNDSNENPYMFTVSGVGVVNGPEIDIQRPVGASKASGSTDALGSVAFGVNLALTYTIANTGNQTLNLTGTPVVAISAINNCSAAVTTMPGAAVPAGINASFVVSYAVAGVGAFGFTLTIASNDADEASYVINVSGTGGTLPDISVRLQSATLADGGNANMGNSNVNSPVTLTFTITNTGNAPLNLAGPVPVVAGGTNNCTAIVTVQPASLTLAAGAQTTFSVEVTAASLAALSFTVSIASDDPDENPFNFTVNGAGSTFIVGSNGNGAGGSCSLDEGGNLWLVCLALSALAGIWLRRRRVCA